MLDRYWAIAPSSMNELLRQEARAESAEVELTINMQRDRTVGAQQPGYQMIEGSGIAMVPVIGGIRKYGSMFQRLFGGAATVDIANAIRQAVSDEQVSQILLYVDSPGGTVQGTADLADVIAQAKQAVPVTAFISDRGMSGAYWLASQASRIVANQTAMVGSIGAFTVIDDWSKAFAKEGVETHVIKDGEFKGIGVIGAPVTDQQIKEVEREIKSLNSHFISAVVQGRGLTEKNVRSMNARVYVGEEAREQGLIDAVETLDETIAQLAGSGPSRTPAANVNGLRVSHAQQVQTNGEHDMQFNTEQLAYLAEHHGLADAEDQKEALRIFNGLAKAERAKIEAMSESDEGDDEPDDEVTGQVAGRVAPQTIDRSQVDEAVASAVARENKRIREVNAVCDRWEKRGYDVTSVRDTLISNPGCTVEQASAKLLTLIETQEPNVQDLPAVTVDARDKLIATASEALCLRAGVESNYIYDPRTKTLTENEQEAKKRRDDARASGIMRHGPQGLARLCLANAGVPSHRIASMDADALYEAVAVGGFNNSTGDFPLILEASAHKTLLNAYENARTTWQIWAREGSVRDFNDHKRLRLSESPLLRDRPEGAPAKHGTFAEERETISVEDKALAVGFTWQAMVNDDTGAFDRTLTLLGEGTNQTIEHELWKMMALNSYAGPVMSDSVTLFHETDHGNQAGSAGAPSQETIQAGVVAFAKQTGFGEDGDKIGLNLMPAFLLGSMDRVMTAHNFLAAISIDEARRTPQLRQIQQLTPVAIPHLTINSRNDWYLTGPKNMAPVEVAFLNGQRQPMLKRVEGTTIAGIQWVVNLPVGVAAIDYRTAYRNPHS